METEEIATQLIETIHKEEKSFILESYTYNRVLDDVVGIAFKTPLEHLKNDAIKLMERGYNSVDNTDDDRNYAYMENDTLYLVKHNQRFDYVIIFQPDGGGFMNDQPTVHMRKYYLPIERDNYDIKQIKEYAQALIDNPEDEAALTKIGMFCTGPDSKFNEFPHHLTLAEATTIGIRYGDGRDIGYIGTFSQGRIENGYDYNLLKYISIDMNIYFMEED